MHQSTNFIITPRARIKQIGVLYIKWTTTCGILCAKCSNYQAIETLDAEQTTSLGETIVQSFVTYKQTGQKILIGQNLVYRPTNP